MSVIPSDIRVYGAANMPEADSATTGGAVDFSKGIDFFDISPTGTMDVVSSSASDTATKITYTGRDATGAAQSVTATLNGRTPVTGSQSLERLEAAAITGGAIAGVSNPGGTAAVGDVALYAHTAVISGHTAQAGSANPSGATPALFKLQSGDGASVALGHIIRITSGTGQYQLAKIVAVSGYGTDIVAVDRAWGTVPDGTSVYDIRQGMLFEVSPNAILARTRLFATASSDAPGGSTRYFYEKVFVVNDNTTTSLIAQSPASGVGIEVVSESPSLPSGVLLDAGPASALNDTATITNRQTAPAGVSFTTQPAYVYVPSPGNLPPGSAPNAAGAMAVWLRLTVPAGSLPYKGAATIQTSGSTV